MPPALGGMPADTPARPASGEELAFPAVHDMPPPRQSPMLSPDQVRRKEAEMARVRDRRTGKQTAEQPDAKQRQRAE
jgi:hypothetical protein